MSPQPTTRDERAQRSRMPNAFSVKRPAGGDGRMILAAMEADAERWEAKRVAILDRLRADHQGCGVATDELLVRLAAITVEVQHVERRLALHDGQAPDTLLDLHARLTGNVRRLNSSIT